MLGKDPPLKSPRKNHTRLDSSSTFRNISVLQPTPKPRELLNIKKYLHQLALTCTKTLFSPKEGHGAKVFYQSESNKFITWALLKLPKSPAAKNVNSFWHEISALAENC